MSKHTGGCYCGDIRYEAEGDALMRVACHCRECQYISGGSANMIIGLAEDGFSYVKGEPAQFTRDDIDNAVTRDFCGNCGTPFCRVCRKILRPYSSKSAQWTIRKLSAYPMSPFTPTTNMRFM